MINRETSLEVTIYYFLFPKSYIMLPFHFNFHDLFFFSSELKQRKYSRNIALILNDHDRKEAELFIHGGHKTKK